jgi:hypothetical protein
MNFYGEVIPIPTRTEPWWAGPARSIGTFAEQMLSAAGGITYWAFGQDERGPHAVGPLGGLAAGVGGTAVIGRAIPALARLYTPLLSSVLGPKASPAAAAAFAAAVLSTAATGLSKAIGDWIDTFAPDLPREERRQLWVAVLESLPWVGAIPEVRTAIGRLAAERGLRGIFGRTLRAFVGSEPSRPQIPEVRPTRTAPSPQSQQYSEALEAWLRRQEGGRVAEEWEAWLRRQTGRATPTRPPSPEELAVEEAWLRRPLRQPQPQPQVQMGSPPPFTEEQLRALAPRPQAAPSVAPTTAFAPRTAAGAHAYMERLISERVLARSSGTEPYRELAMRAASDPEIANWFRRIYGIDPKSDLGIARLVAIIQDYSRHEFRQLMRQ